MKRWYFIILALWLFASNANAQAYRVGTNVTSLSIGYGSNIAGYGYTCQTPSFNFQWERGDWKAGPGVISLGYYMGFVEFHYSNPKYWEKWWYSVLGVRGAYHFTGLNVKNLDLYAGLMPSFNLVNYIYNGSDYSGAHKFSNEFSLTGFAGAKYFFGHCMGTFVEIGYGVTIVQAGISRVF